VPGARGKFKLCFVLKIGKAPRVLEGFPGTCRYSIELKIMRGALVRLTAQRMQTYRLRSHSTTEVEGEGKRTRTAFLKQLVTALKLSKFMRDYSVSFYVHVSG